jgi:hypothetical protein
VLPNTMLSLSDDLHEINVVDIWPFRC